MRHALPRGARRGPAAARARPQGRRPEAAARLPVPLGQAAARSSSTSTRRSWPAAARQRRGIDRRGRARRARRRFSSRAGDGGGRRLREDRARDRAARRRRRGGVPGRPRPDGIGPRPRHPRQLRSARLHLVLHRRRGRVPRLVDSARHPGAARRRRDSQRHRARLHPRRSRRLRCRCIARGSMAACRDHGEVRLEGKEYIVAGRRHHQLPLRDMSEPLDRRARRSSFPAFNEAAVHRAAGRGARSAPRPGTRSSSSTMDRPTTPASGRPPPARASIRHPYNKGNGAAVKTGIRQATGALHPDRRRRRPAPARRRAAARLASRRVRSRRRRALGAIAGQPRRGASATRC